MEIHKGLLFHLEGSGREILSPYLFIICAEALSFHLNQAEANDSISSVPIGKGPICINDLFFTDDSLLFYKSNSL